MNSRQRLEAFEQMLTAVQRDYDDTVAKMERLKDQGKEKSATYRQLMGNRLQYKAMLALYQVYGLLEQPETGVCCTGQSPLFPGEIQIKTIFRRALINI